MYFTPQSEIEEMKDQESLELGDRVCDVISGFSGIVTGLARYLYGCERAQVEAETTKDGMKLEWLDVMRLQKQPGGMGLLLKAQGEAAPGGPSANPRRHDPSR